MFLISKYFSLIRLSYFYHKPFKRCLLISLVSLVVLLGIRSINEVFALFFDDTSSAVAADFLLFQVNLPRFFAALVAGASLSISGVLFQSLSRNLLSSPDLLGVSSGMQIGLVLMLLLPVLNQFGGIPFLFCCGLLAAGLVILVSGGMNVSPTRLLLAATACSIFFSSITQVLLIFFEQHLSGVVIWSSGSLYQSTGQDIYSVLWLIFPLLVLIIPHVLSLEIQMLGDERAKLIGVNLKLMRIIVGCVGVALTALAIGIAGPLAFVGLFIPQIVRMLGIYQLHQLMIASGFLGAFFLCAVDSIIILFNLDNQMMLGMLCMIIGTPILLYLIYKQRDESAVQKMVLQHKLVLNFRWTASVFSLIVIILMFYSLQHGHYFLSWQMLLDKIQGTLDASSVASLMLDLRISRVMIAVLAGMLIAASGLLLQALINNELAGPEILGVSQAAGFFTLLGCVFGMVNSIPKMFLMSILGGFFVVAIIFLINWRKKFSPHSVALSGICLGGIFFGLSQWLIVQSQLQPAQFVVWFAGGLYAKNHQELIWLACGFFIYLPGIFICTKKLSLLNFGDSVASTLGLSVVKWRVLIMILAMMMICSSVVIVGPIGFIGLIIPHMARIMGFYHYGQRMVIAMLMGAILLLCADYIGKNIFFPREIPAGILTSLLSAPYFLAQLFLNRKK